jgi:hypothetical protein
VVGCFIGLEVRSQELERKKEGRRKKKEEEEKSPITN